jgi:hypothetical protein
VIIESPALADTDGFGQFDPRTFIRDRDRRDLAERIDDLTGTRGYRD